mmetsp:Transcript_25375/g.39050  ORF Transcript_25375/g.39050 Transcript_25375/m.39050 type:complete len:174 (-) Transcript_25375:454-975(-)|eukprot:CAMPEP_0195305664 /NCGR_PEP_ID=MMETSP0707-20130614/36701_1 /TAXON_ID=33640 /ORGANISM="Asterionellopsis glacialis, Strain CCMP134" /LENGTH=173 /DNA_ID=CAMNT_0040369841 /DNA_START=53 /DNA_END=574 /DNA_ORIENTATION=+
MSASGNSSDEDDWAMEELPLPKAQSKGNRVKKTNDEEDWGGIQDEEMVADNYWDAINIPTEKDGSEDKADAMQEQKSSSDGEPMILVDMTILSNSAIHNKFDKMSVNDSKAASTLRRRIESNYDTYANNATLLANRTVVPCGTTVWRDALINLRNETPGHYFAPIFPAKKKRT